MAEPTTVSRKEQERLDLQHHLFCLTLENELLLCPADLSKANRILDLGTGTGIWAIEIAEKYPGLSVLGVDLSPIQPARFLPNVEFLIDDIEDTVIVFLPSSCYLSANLSVAAKPVRI
jgi:tRNA1(Val) A37 N6-methylase TrmN6